MARTQEQLLDALAQMGHDGITNQEASNLLDLSGGTVSGQLSLLNKEGRIIRLNDRRKNQSIYVLPRYVNGRETLPYRSNRSKAAVAAVQSDELSAAYRRGYRDGWSDRGAGL